MIKTIFFDMDGTIADFYGVDGWLDYLIDRDPYPYLFAKPKLRFSSFARILNRLQREGYNIGIISWLSKDSDEKYNSIVTDAKICWLLKHLPSVKWDEVVIIPYGTPKELFAHTNEDILFDDEARNRDNWTGTAYDVNNIMEILKRL